MPCPSHPPWLDHSNYTWRRVQVMKRCQSQWPRGLSLVVSSTARMLWSLVQIQLRA
jgi:hypothetical protein